MWRKHSSSQLQMANHRHWGIMGFNDVIVCVNVIKSDKHILFHQTGSMSSDKLFTMSTTIDINSTEDNRKRHLEAHSKQDKVTDLLVTDADCSCVTTSWVNESIITCVTLSLTWLYLWHTEQILTDNSSICSNNQHFSVCPTFPLLREWHRIKRIVRKSCKTQKVCTSFLSVCDMLSCL